MGFGSISVESTGLYRWRLQRWGIQENFEVSALPEDAMREMREGIKTNLRFNTVVETGVPGFIPRAS
jgi:hypothetical protein